MTIQTAYNLIDRLRNETTTKTELNIFSDFLRILSKLKIRELSKEEILSIELKLDELNLESKPMFRKRHFRKALTNFEKHIEESLSLVSKDYYTKLGIVLGASIGMLIGATLLFSWERSLGISLGLIIGSGIGGVIGKNRDNKAMSEGRVI